MEFVTCRCEGTEREDIAGDLEGVTVQLHDDTDRRTANSKLKRKGLNSLKPSLQPFALPSEDPEPAPPPEASRPLNSVVSLGEESVREMAGWLMCYGGDQHAYGSRLKVGRLARASAGTPVAGLFWKKRYAQLKGPHLTCWATVPDFRAPKSKQPKPVAVLLLSQLEEVSVEGRTVTLHVRGQAVSLQARADSESSASSWAAAVKTAASVAIGRSLPPGWDVRAMLSSGQGGSTAKLVHKEKLPSSVNCAFQKLIDHCFVCKSTKDRRGQAVPFRLEVEDVVRVQNGAAWMDYAKARSCFEGRSMMLEPWLQRQVSETGSTESTSSPTSPTFGALSSTASTPSLGLPYPILTSTLRHQSLTEILGETESQSNEYWLFHGTSAAGVQGISDQEFRLDYAGTHRGTLYGKGIYFAECTTKADEYSHVDEDGYCWMLLCRVALGKAMVCKDKKPPPDILSECQKQGYDSLIGDRWAAVGTFREFILFDSNQVYPAFVIRYKRWTEAAFCRSIRETAETRDAAAAAALFPHAAILAEEHPDSSVRYRLSLLLDAHAEAVVPALSRALSDPRRRVRLHVTKALMNMAGQTSLVEALPDGSTFRRHREGKPIIAQAVGGLTTCLGDDDRFVRRAAARALERLGEHAAPAVPALIRSLKDLEVEVRAAVATALGQLGSAASQALPALLEAADDPEELVRVAAMGALGHLGTEESVAMLITHLSDASAEVKSAAAAALGMLGPGRAASAVEPLAKTLRDSQAHVRLASARALGQLGAKSAAAVPELIPCLKDSDHAVRRAAAVALGRIGTFATPAAAALADCMRDENSQVREAAATSMSRLGLTEKIASTVVIQALIKRGLTDFVAEVRQSAAESLADLSRLEQLGSQRDAVQHAMTVRLKDESTKVRNTASSVLKLFEIQREASLRQDRAERRANSGSGSEIEDEHDDDGLDLEDIARIVRTMAGK